MRRLTMKRNASTFLFCLLGRSALASLLPMDMLLPRDDSCADRSASRCAGDFPDNFCCPSNTNCLSLDRGSAVLCCPKGQECDFIAPITCDVSQQNATAHPENPVHTKDLSTKLDTCGAKCCPQGFKCEQEQCALDKAVSGPASSSSSSAGPSATSTTTTSRPTPPTSAPTLSTPTPRPSSSPTTLADLSTSNPEPQCAAFPGRAVVAGFFPGVALGALLAAACFLLCARRRSKISAPLYQQQNICRSDFLRKSFPNAGSRTAGSSPAAGSASPAPSKPRSLFRKSEAPTEATSMEFVLSEAPLMPMPGTMGSGTGAGTARLSQVTAFTDMMEGAGFKRGEPFFVPAESRGRDI
ncbi:MAG: hypothetical protein M1832_002293 [Thelocarpon impressellum]|nr:MAG: hypothetical protein M1832_002293 [Thelocarpon impressellum]